MLTKGKIRGYDRPIEYDVNLKPCTASSEIKLPSIGNALKTQRSLRTLSTGIPGNPPAVAMPTDKVQCYSLQLP